MTEWYLHRQATASATIVCECRLFKVIEEIEVTIIRVVGIDSSQPMPGSEIDTTELPSR